ncbi:hypothetical protein FEI13_05005 [Halomonas urmiana]|uniref:Uncharacterized protein n=1 Tax=Halomonas urmiana TaxID=490901 RepID=A0A5R8MK10_9GAMM|nr:hypothetical protein [Halomonas urmiana]TLF52238.1 hypothetical protein FEI13_05005 [Halomonas urmiana]
MAQDSKALDHQVVIVGSSTLKFYSGGGALFSVPAFVPPLERGETRYRVGAYRRLQPGAVGT